MRFNKKGFTLVELVIVVIILGVILVFALPNITSTLERNKKDQMIIDAKDMVDKAKNHALKTGKYPIDDGNSTTEDCERFYLKDIDLREELKESPFGKIYKRDASYVKICLSLNSYKYEVYLYDDGNNKIQTDDYMKLNEAGKYDYVKID